jgi:hypothetical protein
MTTDRVEVPRRLLAIVAISAGVGAATVAALLFAVEPGPIDSKDPIFMVTVIAIAWPYTFIPTLLGGFALYYIHRRWRLSRLTLLIASLGVAIPLAYLFYPVAPHAGWIALATATAGWLIYCFGPLAIWRKDFDDSSGVDF